MSRVPSRLELSPAMQAKIQQDAARQNMAMQQHMATSRQVLASLVSDAKVRDTMTMEHVLDLAMDSATEHMRRYGMEVSFRKVEAEPDEPTQPKVQR